NQTVANWTDDLGLQLINFTPGTRSNADYTYPQLGIAYRSSEEIYQSIIDYDNKHSLNGFILLLHIGTDARRKDKFYDKLPQLLRHLKQNGYKPVTISQLLSKASN